MGFVLICHVDCCPFEILSLNTRYLIYKHLLVNKIADLFSPLILRNFSTSLKFEFVDKII